MKKVLMIALCFMVFLMTPSGALALTITLADPNTALNPYPAPYATAELTLVDSDTARIVVTTAACNYWLGDGGSFSFNPGSDVTNVLTNLGGKFKSLDFGGNISGFGKMGVAINMTRAWPDAVSTMTITFDKVSGTWGNESEVLTQNAQGYLAAAHIFVGTTPGVGDALVTGYAGDGYKVPEPLTLILLGFGLVSLAGVRRFHK